MTSLLTWFLVVQDHHPLGHISFASRHEVEPFATRTVPVPGSSETKQQEMWPDHCVQGTRGAEIEDGVRERIDKLGGVVVKKVGLSSHHHSIPSHLMLDLIIFVWFLISRPGRGHRGGRLLGL